LLLKRILKNKLPPQPLMKLMKTENNKQQPLMKTENNKLPPQPLTKTENNKLPPQPLTKTENNKLPLILVSLNP
jgi:hypothetical protein